MAAFWILPFLDLLEYFLKKKKKTGRKPGMMICAFNFSTWEAEFKASLIYIESPRPARVT